MRLISEILIEGLEELGTADDTVEKSQKHPIWAIVVLALGMRLEALGEKNSHVQYWENLLLPEI